MELLGEAVGRCPVVENLPRQTAASTKIRASGPAVGGEAETPSGSGRERPLGSSAARGTAARNRGRKHERSSNIDCRGAFLASGEVLNDHCLGRPWAIPRSTSQRDGRQPREVPELYKMLFNERSKICVTPPPQAARSWPRAGHFWPSWGTSWSSPGQRWSKLISFEATLVDVGPIDPGPILADSEQRRSRLSDSGPMLAGIGPTVLGFGRTCSWPPADIGRSWSDFDVAEPGAEAPFKQCLGSTVRQIASGVAGAGWAARWLLYAAPPQDDTEPHGGSRVQPTCRRGVAKTSARWSGHRCASAAPSNAVGRKRAIPRWAAICGRPGVGTRSPAPKERSRDQYEARPRARNLAPSDQCSDLKRCACGADLRENEREEWRPTRLGALTTSTGGSPEPSNACTDWR